MESRSRSMTGSTAMNPSGLTVPTLTSERKFNVFLLLFGRGFISFFSGTGFRLHGSTAAVCLGYSAV
jgi:hypothetical protein